MYKIKQSPIDKQYYAVFKNNYEAARHGGNFKDCPIACFNGYDNAYRISSKWCK